MKSLRGLRNIRQHKYFCSGVWPKEGAGGARERNLTLILVAVVVLFAVVFAVTVVVEIKEARSDSLPLVSSNSYLEHQDNINNHARAVRSHTGEGSQRIRGVVVEVEEDGHREAAAAGSPLAHAYHLLGGPLNKAAPKEAEKKKWVALTKGNVPDAYARPGQWGMRAPRGYGGAEDEELLMVVPQGSPQPAAPEGRLEVDIKDADAKSSIQSQIDLISRRYYDASDMLSAYQMLINNQHRVGAKFGGKPRPIQEVRELEDELPLKLRW